MIDGFEHLSNFYDDFVGADYDKIAHHVHQKLKEHLPQATYGVDLGCGSGTLTFLLSDLGYDMIGIDRSDAMLSQALTKKGDRDILFLQQDLTEIDLYGAADFMVSSLDCINYLNDINEVQTFLKGCTTFLKPDGLLIFDFNTLHKYADVLDGKNFVYETDKVFCVWENSFDGKNMHYDLTYFENNGKHYDRFEDYQRQTYFSCDQITEILEGLGYKILALEDNYSNSSIGEKTERIVLTAQKRR